MSVSILITVKKYIASSARYLVFEQNTEATRTRFLNIVNPYLAGIQQRSGLTAFRVVMDETNRKFFYKNQNYQLPYTKNEFLRKLGKYQTKGVLGMVDDGTIFEKLKGKTPLKRSDNITLIMTEGKTHKEISNKWKEIEKILKDV